MDINGKTFFITGACGGIGVSLIDALVAKKAKKIYASDINLDKLSILQDKHPSIIPIKLDVLNEQDILTTVKFCADTQILINNAGIERATKFLDSDSLKSAQLEMMVNYFGVHNLCHSFWELLRNKESSAIVNILSIASFVLILKLGTYCASKTAAHILTKALRKESEKTNLKVFAVYPGYVDTEMTKDIEVEKTPALQIANEICKGIEANVLDIFPDNLSTNIAVQVDSISKDFIFTDFNK